MSSHSLTKTEPLLSPSHYIERLSGEIFSREKLGIESSKLALLGLKTRGVPLAHRLAHSLFQLSGVEVPVGELDISLHRDDAAQKISLPQITSIPFKTEQKRILIVDDVLFTGRTVRAALQLLNDFGRFSYAALAVLIDRGHRELPIQADYIGASLQTEHSDKVILHLKETDNEDKIILQKAQ